ncbi:MAG: HNH endonuclease [Phycisphaerae bacterium]|nr:HNH endonuclease [Phycisphaerae bacterium]
MAEDQRQSKLDSLSQVERQELTERLRKAQNGLCYICQDVINRQVHKTDIDHIIALALGGADDESNWALAHDACNRSKGTRDLQLQRILHEFRKHVQEYAAGDANGRERSFTLHEALQELCPTRQEVGVVLDGDRISVSWTEQGHPKTEVYPILEEPGHPGARSFVARLPFGCLHHDHQINPRSIVDLEPMIEEFYTGYPQLQPSLATLTFDGSEGKAPVLVFDGQHKAAAQLYARRDRLFVRVFVNYSRERLKETNYRAHTKLAQVHFPQLINDRVGADLLREEFDRFVQGGEFGKISEDSFFTKHLQRAQRGEYRKYFGNWLRYEVLIGKAGAEQNSILNFTETVMPRSIRNPLSYDTLQKTFLDLMIYTRPAREPLDQTDRYRRLEKENLVRLMNIFAEEVLANGRFNLELGIRRMEERLANDPQSVPDSHLRAYRLCRKAAMVIWTRELKGAIQLLLGTKTRYKIAGWGERRPLWAEILDEDWQQVRKMIRAIREHKVWGERTNPDIVAAISSTRQKDWNDILLKGTLPGRQEQLLPPLDQNFMFRSIAQV